IVDTNLAGLGLDLPAPMHKDAGESLPSRFEMLGLNSSDPNLQREEIKIALGTAINARYEREKNAERNAPWRLARGTIGVFSPTTPPAKGVLLNVSLKSLNADAWSDLISAITSDKAPQGNTPPGGGL